MIALGLELQGRGHRATVLTNAWFQELIEKCGLGFLPVGTVEQARATLADPNLWHPTKGFEVIARDAILPSMGTAFRLIEKHATANTVVAASGISFGARIAQEKLGVPTATVHLQPSVIRSLVDQGMAGQMRISAKQPMWFKQAFFRLADWMLVDRILKGPINEFRRTLGLQPIDRVMHRWMHSPQLVIGFFPEWFAPPQPDWPQQTHLVGFPLWDRDSIPLPAEAEEFIAEGNPPLVITPGSAGATMQRYFKESVEAARLLGVRTILVTDFPEQLPADLPVSIKAFRYLPFSKILPRTSMLVYHGGIGTLAQVIKAGIPHLVVPNGYDQFDNGWRIEQLGLGRAIPQTRYRARQVADVIRNLLGDESLGNRCSEYSARVNSASALKRASELIETLRPNR
jgi:UDP:flavonoid glycosyltransferase YjiC (YdhE family)